MKIKLTKQLLLLVIVIAACPCSLNAQVVSQPKEAIPRGSLTPNAPDDPGPVATFSLESPQEIGNLARNLKAARRDSAAYLERLARGEVTDLKKAATAAWFLGEMRCNDEVSVLALCANIGRSIPSGDRGEWGPPHALSERAAALALIKIGGSGAAETMIGRLRHEVTEKELRTYAYVFYEMDKVPVTLKRLDLAIERETTKPLFPSGPDRKYLQRIDFIKVAILDPKSIKSRPVPPSDE